MDGHGRPGPAGFLYSEATMLTRGHAFPGAQNGSDARGWSFTNAYLINRLNQGAFGLKNHSV
jgi:hypothetical protein